MGHKPPVKPISKEALKRRLNFFNERSKLDTSQVKDRRFNPTVLTTQRPTPRGTHESRGKVAPFSKKHWKKLHQQLIQKEQDNQRRYV